MMARGNGGFPLRHDVTRCAWPGEEGRGIEESPSGKWWSSVIDRNPLTSKAKDRGPRVTPLALSLRFRP